MRLKRLIIILWMLDIKWSALSMPDEKIVRNKNCTTLLPRLHVFKRHVLSRRKRGVVFPKKSFMLITQAFTKAIIDGRPPGVAYSIEFDMYSELPDTLEAWKPTLLLDKIKNEKNSNAEGDENGKNETQATPLPTPMPSNMQMDIEADMDNGHDHNVWPIDYEYTSNIDYHHYDPIMLDSPKWQTPFNFSRRWENIRSKYENEMKNLYKKQTWKKGKRKQMPPSTEYFKNDINQNWPPREEIYESVEHVPIWKYDRSYRERRNLFDQFETLGQIFNIDMRSCIQRAMCEMSSNLRPYGESLMDDIVRIILTIPKKVNYGDEYSFDFRQYPDKSHADCKTIFKRNCPYRVIDFLTATLRTAKLEEHQRNDDSRSAGIVRSHLV